ncbi:DUF2917 domain-containing protein [Hydrogenophaga sp. YM1]|uniref:DUF2917 domain-containing protein n=1 Tax=Hydrogenophaga sp. YM1 TaxID=2806262 RepID=UPI001959A780|nr:DUF2917 domain-containing protein [Hydrogenophaga sp. YM1]QRR34921.1 DUF2917 domain-containing protein [Hydrogenophaga sp. YM1]
METRSESASTSQRPGFAVGAHRAISLRPAEDSRLLITAGRAWVTLNLPHQPDGFGDHRVCAGESLLVPAGAHLVMEPWTRGDALRFDWSVLPQAEARPQRFSRDVVKPSRELALALGQAALAFGRLLRGVLGYTEFLVAGRGRVLSRFESNPP